MPDSDWSNPEESYIMLEKMNQESFYRKKKPHPDIMKS